MIRLGLGSWSDSDYTGILYPAGLPPAQRLACYARHFNHVEVNSSYYATPKRDVVKNWVAETPPGFTFDVKLHRAFSASPDKTARDGALLGYFLKGLQPLIRARKLRVLLLVLPPEFSPGRHQLEELEVLARKLRPHPLAVELRDGAWVRGRQRQRTLDFFRARELMWVAVDMPRIAGSPLMPPVDAVTHPRFAYLRLHGRNQGWLTAKTAAERHAYNYTPCELQALALRVRRLADLAGEVHVIANNHAHDFAPKTALGLKALLRPYSNSRAR